MALSAVYRAPFTVDLVDTRVEQHGPKDIRVRVDACGICGSDLVSYTKGSYVHPGQVMGHEFVATVLAAGGEVQGVTAGDQVMVRPLRTCGECWYCHRGEIHLCGASGRTSYSYGRPGGYCEELVLHDIHVGQDVVVLTPGVSVLDAVWAEPFAVALHAVQLAGVAPGNRVLVTGAGSIGLCLARAATLAGARVVVAEPREPRRQASLALGTVEAVADLAALPAASVDVVLDSSGRADVLEDVLRVLTPGGIRVAVGVTGGRVKPAVGVLTRGSFGYTAEEFVRACRLINDGRARLGSAVTHQFDLHDFSAAMDTAANDPTAGKVVIRP